VHCETTHRPTAAGSLIAADAENGATAATTRLANAAAHWRGSFGGVACVDFVLRAVVEASASTASIARLFLCMVLRLRSVAMLWLSVIAFCTGIAFGCVLAEHVSCAGG